MNLIAWVVSNFNDMAFKRALRNAPVQRLGNLYVKDVQGNLYIVDKPRISDSEIEEFKRLYYYD